jgi:hypothetical protein
VKDDAEYIAQQIESHDRQKSMPEVTVDGGGEPDTSSANRMTTGA